MTETSRRGMILVESADRASLTAIKVSKTRSYGMSSAIEEYPETVMTQDGDDLVLRIVGGAR